MGLGAEEEQLLASIPESIARLVVWNKMDHAACSAPAAGAIACSALCGWRLEEVRQAAVHRAAARLPLSEGAELLVTSARQAAVLQQANGALYSAEAALERGDAVELIAAELRVAAARLGELTGQEVSSHVIDEIFARFCVGK